MKKRVMSLLVTVALGASILVGCGNSGADQEKLYVYNWTEYIPQSIYDAFEEETGIKVVEATFTSNEEMLAKITAGGSGQYDIIIASNYVVESMVEQEMIQEINKENITNFDNLSEESTGLSFDPDNTYSIPYMGGITLVAINTQKCEELGVTITELDDLLNPALENNIVAVDDVREIVALALKAQGEDANTQDEAVIEATLPWLQEFNKNVKAYDSDSPKTLLISNEVAVGVVYNTDIGAAIDENENIQVISTVEPGEMSIDNFVITAGSQNKENAELFIDFMLRPEIYKIALEEFPGLCVNDAALEILDDSYLNNPGSNVDAEEIERAHLIEDVGEAVSIYDEVFTKMKTN